MADTDGICMECHLHPLTGPGVAAGLCSKCRVNPRQPGSAHCGLCQSEINRRYYRQRKAVRAPDKPCACCGGGPRHNGTSYCAKCVCDYQAERRAGQGVTA